jgi:hypothetical protein
MWYYRARLWFSLQVLLYNICLALPVAAFGNAFYVLLIFLSFGFASALLATSIIHKQQRFAMLNLGISKISLVLFAWIVQVVFLIVISLLVLAVMTLYGF